MGYSQYGRIANTCPKRETVRLGDTQYARPASCSRPVRARAARRAGYAVVARPPAASYPLRTAPPSSLAQQAAPLPLPVPYLPPSRFACRQHVRTSTQSIRH